MSIFLCDLSEGELSMVSSGSSDCRDWFVPAPLLLSCEKALGSGRRSSFPPTCLYLGTVLPVPHLTQHLPRHTGCTYGDNELAQSMSNRTWRCEERRVVNESSGVDL